MIADRVEAVRRGKEQAALEDLAVTVLEAREAAKMEERAKTAEKAKVKAKASTARAKARAKEKVRASVFDVVRQITTPVIVGSP